MYREEEKRALEKFLADPNQDLELIRARRNDSDGTSCQLETLAKEEAPNVVA
jgi:hypothetical protein